MAQNANGIAAMLFGLGAKIVMPLMYALVGFIGGLIGAALYNPVASLVGGIELDIQRPIQPATIPQGTAG